MENIPKPSLVLFISLIVILGGCQKESISTLPNNDSTTLTYSGKVYHTIKIDNQTWLKENLDVGTMVQGDQNQINNGTIEKYCYNDDPSNCTIYGGLYKWDEAMAYSIAQGAQGICPDGWHIPTLSEFEILKKSVNDDGNSLKSVGQGAGNGNGTNTTGFSALLAGCHNYDNTFTFIGEYSIFWSSTANNDTVASHQNLTNFNSNFYTFADYKTSGYSIRCLKD